MLLLLLLFAWGIRASRAYLMVHLEFLLWFRMHVYFVDINANFDSAAEHFDTCTEDYSVVLNI